jgi:hypothetical protein
LAKPRIALAQDLTPGIVVPGGKATYAPKGVGRWEDLPLPKTKLGKERLLANELAPLQQPFLGDQELYYPQFLFGSWNVKATLKRKVFPYGVNYLPSESLLEGSPRNREELVGNVCNYTVHYFSTLANTLANQLTVNLGTGVPASKIIQDRAFNAISISKAYQQLALVQDVRWDYRQNPIQLSLGFESGALAEDMRPLGPRRAEVYIQARTSETGSEDPNIFCAAERTRSVTIAGRDVVVSDLETITEFQQSVPGHVVATNRLAVYLTPNPNSREGLLWQQTGGKAVAFYDYELDMKREKEEFTLSDGTVQSKVCVQTPKDVVQCE